MKCVQRGLSITLLAAIGFNMALVAVTVSQARSLPRIRARQVAELEHAMALRQAAEQLADAVQRSASSLTHR